MYNDDWMREKGFLEKSGMTARDLVAARLSGELCAIEANEPVEHALRLMSEQDFSQILDHPRQAAGRLAQRDAPLRRAGANPSVKRSRSRSIMQPAFPFVDVSTPVDLLQTMITPQNPAVLVRDFKTDKTFIITRSDLIRVM
jgi:cystathionine beta-synthase